MKIGVLTRTIQDKDGVVHPKDEQVYIIKSIPRATFDPTLIHTVLFSVDTRGTLLEGEVEILNEVEIAG